MTELNYGIFTHLHHDSVILHVIIINCISLDFPSWYILSLSLARNINWNKRLSLWYFCRRCIAYISLFSLLKLWPSRCHRMKYSPPPSAASSSSFIFKSLIKLKTKDNKSFQFNLISSCLTLCKRNKQKSKLLLHLECTSLPFRNQLLITDESQKIKIFILQI